MPPIGSAPLHLCWVLKLNGAVKKQRADDRGWAVSGAWLKMHVPSGEEADMDIKSFPSCHSWREVTHAV